MPALDHLGITVADVPYSIARFDPMMQALGCTRRDEDNGVSWSECEEDLMLKQRLRVDFQVR